MNKDQISAEFDAFFEFDTDDKRTVTSVSCKLFAQVIVGKALAKQATQIEDAKKCHARYEYVRKLDLHQFSNIYIDNIVNGIPFDDQVDAAIQEGK